MRDGPLPLQPPSGTELAAGIASGSVALLMLGLQPLLLGALAEERRLDEAGIGAAATAELLALGLTAGLLATLAAPRRLRLVNVAAALVLAGFNLSGMVAQGAWLVASRAGAGVASGVIVWIAASLITRALRPDRMSGVFLTVQTLAQAGLAALLPLTLMARYGANGGLAGLAALAVLATGASRWLPPTLVPLPKADAQGGGPPASALVGLAFVFFSMAGIVGLWVFIEQLGAGARIGSWAAGLAVAAALVAQVIGGLSGTLLSGRLPATAVLLGASVADIVVTRVLGHAIGPGAYLGSIILFGFLWLFIMPFQVALLVELDPSRRAALLLPAIQLLGSAAGPAFTSAFATGSSLGGALDADGVLFAVAVVCLVVLKASSPFLKPIPTNLLFD